VSIRLAALTLACLLPTLARGEPVWLRLAGVAPDGASWTRELKTFGRDVETRTEGRVKVKWYWGGLAGDEMKVLERIRRSALDGQAGVEFCSKLAASLAVLRVLGLFQDRNETVHILQRLSGTVDQEFRQNGFVGFATTMGSDVLFTREPLRSVADLRKTKLWMWDLDDVVEGQLRKIGGPVVPMPFDKAAHADDVHQIDGFVSIPSAALAFQWSAQTRWFTELRVASLPGCLVIANRVYDALAVRDQHAVREAIAVLRLRFDDVGRTL